MTGPYDAIIIGGGHNGLVSAAYLARAGKKVLVLERRHVLGGAAVTEEVFPGFQFSVCSYVVSLLRPEIIRELDLARHGMEILPLDGTFTPLPSGDYLWRTNDHQKTRREIARFSRLDAEAYDEYGKAMIEMGRFVKPLMSMTPPDPTRLFELADLLPMLQRFVRMPSGDQYNLVQLMTLSAVDFLDGWFETDPLKATMAASGIIGTFLGVRSPGTAYVLLHHYMGEIDGAFRSWGFSRGGTGAISNAIAAAAQAAGAEIRTKAPVAKVLLGKGGDRATGVVLESGEEIFARTVCASVDPRLLFMQMVGERNLPDDFVAAIRRYKFRGSSGKVNLALDGLPDFRCLPGAGPHLRGAISISPSIEYMERAYDDAKYGRFSQRPYIDIVIPSLTDPSVAPPGKHVMSCFVQYAPYKLRQGSWDDQREAFGDTVIDTISEHAPNLKSLIRHRQVLTPLDIEREFGLSEGNIFQGELSLEQLFFLRPAPGYAQYRTPIRGLYMCGSATHPGGGIMGAPGRNAAERVLADWRKGAI